MFRNNLYYGIKPVVPVAVRLPVRRWFAQRKRQSCAASWPIFPGSERAPAGWAGWPEGKQFAFVLTHDVEGRSGLEKCERLMELEKSLGFRSSFNFVPEGEYRVGRALRERLVAEGFEVGVHDLCHDGKLYRNRQQFGEMARRINEHLKDWNAVGFRSGFMLHNLDWLRELDVAYDASTFDTDPFEPQPDGAHTIFPFWVPGKNGGSPHNGNGHGQPGEKGYVELPYTLPQDSTLFILFREKSLDIWTRKLSWLAQNGGMALLNVHPDYLDFGDGKADGRTFPVERYASFLRHVRETYDGKFWHALPREVAALVKQRRKPLALNGFAKEAGAPEKSTTGQKIWIDLDNTPHVPFFEPILRELERRGFQVILTARDAFQVCDLATEKGLKYVRIGQHHGRHRLLKALGLVYRAMQMAPLALRERPTLNVSHGSRSQILLSNWLRIPTILIEDYEHSAFPPMMRPTWVIAPEVIPDKSLCGRSDKIRKYPGIKEDVYAWKLQPDPELLPSLGLDAEKVIVTVRPPATEAHYHNPEAESLFVAFMERASADPAVRVVLLPRNKKQGELLRQKWPEWFEGAKAIIPSRALDGLNLIWSSDLVVSGGGTMNREAAALRVPVYSIFRGRIGAVDHHLQKEGRLLLIETLRDVNEKILLAKRARRPLAEETSRRTLDTIVSAIAEIALARPRR